MSQYNSGGQRCKYSFGDEERDPKMLSNCPYRDVRLHTHLLTPCHFIS